MPRNRSNGRGEMLTALRMIRRGASKTTICQQLRIDWRTLNAMIERAGLLYLEVVEASQRQGALDDLVDPHEH